MTLVVYILGAVLVVLGAAFIAMGVPIVRMEIGWTEVIGGSVAGSAGFVILVLGVFLSRFEGLHRTILDLRDAPQPRDAQTVPVPVEEVRLPVSPIPHPLAPSIDRDVDESVPDEPVRPEPAMAEAPLHRDAVDDMPARFPFGARRSPELGEGAPTLSAQLDDGPMPPPRISLDPVEGGAEPERPRPNFLSSFLAKRTAGVVPTRPTEWGDRDLAPPTRSTPIPVEPEEDEPAPHDDERFGLRTSTYDDEPARPQQAPIHADEPQPRLPELDDTEHVAETDRAPEPEPPAKPDPTGPVVVGRYNAGSASYVMYSNGMIEVETDSGTHQFASMQELKAFIERRDAAQV